MTKSLEKISDKAWLPPGSLVHVGQVREHPTRAFIMDYDESGYEEWEGVVAVEKKLPTLEKEVRWIHLDGVHQPEVIKQIGETYSIHNLTLEDILNTEHRPKIDETDDGFFLIAKRPTLREEGTIIFTSVNIIFGDFGVISLADVDEDPFSHVRSRIRNASGKIRKRGGDYLVYTLLDTVIDSYLIVIDQLHDQILQLEEEALHNTRPESLVRLQSLQRIVLQLRQMVQPMRDMVAKLCRIDDQLIDDSTKKYFQDVLDHITAVSANTDHFRELLTSILELHVSMMNNRMNQIVKLLTVFAAIFMPLTFIVGIYGMNFKYMPELDYRYGYFFSLLFMAVLSILMVLFFRRKKWL